MQSQAFTKDIMEWEKFPDYDILYTDPPWGDRMIKWFANKLQRDLGIVKSYPDLTTILNHLGKLANPNKPLIIEYSVNCEFVIEVMESYGHTLNRKFVRLSKKKNPFAIMVFNCELEIDEKSVGLPIVTESVQKLGAGVVFDPFAGRGWFAKSVHKAGLHT